MFVRVESGHPARPGYFRNFALTGPLLPATSAALIGTGQFKASAMFVFFSNKLGIAGSIAVTILLSLVLLKACSML